MKTIGFVIPWYGDKIPGGAESACRSCAKHLKNAGYDVEIITTCIKEFKTDWNQNYYKPGLTQEAGISVRRFSVVPIDKQRFSTVNSRFMNHIPVSDEEEHIFFSEMISSPTLISYLKEYYQDYQAFIFLPYMFQTTIEGVAAVKDKAIIMPCLHDESYAYTNAVKNLMESACGIIYLSRPEYDLAQKLYHISETVQQMILGVFLSEPEKELNNYNVDVTAFCNKYGLHQPYILYAGRKDNGKNADLLEAYFLEYKSRHTESPYQLVFIGDQTKSQSQHRDIIDLGFVTLEEKYAAMAGSLFLCQPSIMESFSIVIMENWLMGRPVLIHKQCQVTKNFVVESNGGLWFDCYSIFSCVLDYYLTNQTIGNAMAALGKKYVQENFDNQVMIEKLINFLKKF